MVWLKLTDHAKLGPAVDAREEPGSEGTHSLLADLKLELYVRPIGPHPARFDDERVSLEHWRWERLAEGAETAEVVAGRNPERATERDIHLDGLFGERAIAS